MRLLLAGIVSFLLLGCGKADLSTTPSSPTLALSASDATKQALGVIQPRLEHSVTGNGFVLSNFDSNWIAKDNNDTVRLYHQARVIYLMCQGAELTGDPSYQEAVKSTSDFMLKYMFDDLSGGWYTSADASGEVKSNKISPYDNAFAVFAMAHAYKTTKDDRYLNAAMKTWLVGDVWPGLQAARYWRDSKAFSEKDGVWYQNPFMHLFEALLALYDVTGSTDVLSELGSMAAFVDGVLQQPDGAIPEYFNFSDFSPQAPAEGGHIVVGHQVEWAYLLNKAVDAGLPARFRITADRAFDFAIKVGWSPDEGVLRSKVDYAGKLLNDGADWWAQAELLRLTAYLVQSGVNTDTNTRLFNQNYDYVHSNLIDEKAGGWYSQPKGATKVLGYHSVAMYMQVIEHKH